MASSPGAVSRCRDLLTDFCASGKAEKRKEKGTKHTQHQEQATPADANRKPDMQKTSSIEGDALSKMLAAVHVPRIKTPVATAVQEEQNQANENSRTVKGHAVSTPSTPSGTTRKKTRDDDEEQEQENRTSDAWSNARTCNSKSGGETINSNSSRGDPSKAPPHSSSWNSSRQSGDGCFTCGALGHLSRECPSGKGCFACGATGHWSRECPNKGGVRPQGGSTIASKGTDETSSRSEGGTKRTCYCCGEMGHNAAECPRRAGGSARSGGCFICSKIGHISRDCPSRSMGATSAPQRSNENPSPSKNSGSRGYSSPVDSLTSPGVETRSSPTKPLQPILKNSSVTLPQSTWTVSCKAMESPVPPPAQPVSAPQTPPATQWNPPPIPSYNPSFSNDSSTVWGPGPQQSSSTMYIPPPSNAYIPPAQSTTNEWLGQNQMGFPPAQHPPPAYAGTATFSSSRGASEHDFSSRTVPAVPPTKTSTCFACNQPGHFARQCPRNSLRPVRYRSRSRSRSRSPPRRHSPSPSRFRPRSPLRRRSRSRSRSRSPPRPTIALRERERLNPEWGVSRPYYENT